MVYLMKKAFLLVGFVAFAYLLLAGSARADVATVTLSGLSQTYDGTAKPVTVTTDPSGLTVDITYDANSDAPTNAGSYSVVATVNDATYTGSATDTLVINRADAIILFANTSKTYDGTPLTPIVTTSPPGLGLSTYYLYIGSNGPIFNPPALPGTYLEWAHVVDPNYQGTNHLFFQILKVGATVTFSGLNQAYDGTPKHVNVLTTPAGLNVDVSYNSATNLPVDIGDYYVFAKIKDPIYGGSASDTMVIFNPDTNAPVLAVRSPVNGSAQPNPNITVIGVARDKGPKATGVASVEYSLNGADPVPVSTANNFTNWTAPVTLAPGWNTFVVTATDNAGNTSSVTRTWLNAPANSVFGRYYGLFYEYDAANQVPVVTLHSAGFLTVVVANDGYYTGVIRMAGSNYPFAGQFDHDIGVSFPTVSRGAHQPLYCELFIDWTGAAKYITGYVGCQQEGWSAYADASLKVNNANNPFPAARSTMVIEPAADAPVNSPGGWGYGLVNVTASGTITLQGNLADSSPIKQTVAVGPNGEWPLYVELYKNRGLLLGWMQLDDGVPSGRITWFKPARAPVALTTYRAGFTNIVHVRGSSYVPADPAFNPIGTLDITDGSGLNLPLSLDAAITSNSAIVSTPPTTNLLSGSIMTSTGLMKLTFQPTGVGAVTKTAIGVVLQGQNTAYGAFIGNNDGAGKTNTGAVYLH
jgi:hypothetical protein